VSENGSRSSECVGTEPCSLEESQEILGIASQTLGDEVSEYESRVSILARTHLLSTVEDTMLQDETGQITLFSETRERYDLIPVQEVGKLEHKVTYVTLQTIEHLINTDDGLRSILHSRTFCNLTC
jgi:hypothetical protein